jgi:hypothetical protein
MYQVVECHCGMPGFRAYLGRYVEGKGVFEYEYRAIGFQAVGEWPFLRNGRACDETSSLTQTPCQCITIGRPPLTCRDVIGLAAT